MEKEFRKAGEIGKRVKVDDANYDLGHGDVVIAAITSCTNTSNPSVMIGAGLLARNAVEEGPDLQAVGEDLARARIADRRGIFQEGRPAGRPRCARLQPRRLRLHHLHRQFGPAAGEHLEGDQRQRPRRRVGALGQPQLRGPREPGRARELPRLAAAGGRLCARRLHAGRSRQRSAWATGSDGKPVYLKDIWPSSVEVQEFIDRTITSELFKTRYADVFSGDANWKKVTFEPGLTYDLAAPARPMCRTRPISRA